MVMNIDKLLKVVGFFFFFAHFPIKTPWQSDGIKFVGCILIVWGEDKPSSSVFNKITAEHFRVLKAHGLLIPACFIMYF